MPGLTNVFSSAAPGLSTVTAFCYLRSHSGRRKCSDLGTFDPRMRSNISSEDSAGSGSPLRIWEGPMIENFVGSNITEGQLFTAEGQLKSLKVNFSLQLTGVPNEFGWCCNGWWCCCCTVEVRVEAPVDLRKTQDWLLFRKFGHQLFTFPALRSADKFSNKQQILGANFFNRQNVFEAKRFSTLSKLFFTFLYWIYNM